MDYDTLKQVYIDINNISARLEAVLAEIEGRNSATIKIITKAGHEYVVTDADISMLQLKYPTVNVRQEARAAAFWHNSQSRAKRHSDMPRFLNNWMRRRAEDRAKPGAAGDIYDAAEERWGDE